MKISSFCFLVIGYAALVPGANAQAAAGAQQTPTKNSAGTGSRPNNGFVSHKDRPRGFESSIKTPSKQPPTHHVGSSAAKTGAKVQSSAAHQSSGAGKNQAVPAAPAKSAQSPQAASAARSAMPSRNDARHHGANPAIVGLAASNTSRNTAALNGTSMRRRP